MEESTKKNLHPKLLLLTASVILVCIVALVAQIPKKKPEPQIDVTTTLEKIVKTSDLSTAVFQYQGIVEIPNQKNLKKIDYYICYTASVYAGIDFSEVTFSENKETKTPYVVVSCGSDVRYFLCWDWYDSLCRRRNRRCISRFIPP